MRRIDMIGTPLDHARSPGLLNPVFRARGEDVEVVKRELGPDDVPGYVAAVRHDPDAIGLIVTTPLKQAIVPWLAERTALVAFLGASNCVRFDRDGWIGANFDGHGFIAALSAMRIGALAGKRILLAGCGGAGSAIAASLTEAAAVDLALHDKDRGRAADLAGRLARFAPAAKVGAVDGPAGRYDVVVNASTAGMHSGDLSPIPEATVQAAGMVADIVTADDTALKRAAQALGKPVLAGGAMVAGQVDLLRRFLLGRARTERDVLLDEG